MDKQSQYLTSFQRKQLLKSLGNDIRPEYRRRIQIMLLADEGQSQTQICKALGCSQETARHWMVIAQTGQAHHWRDRPMGSPKKIDAQYLDRLKELVNNSPRDYGYAFNRWTGQWLSKQLTKELGIKITGGHVNRLLKQMGLSTRQKSTTEEAENQIDTDNFSLVIRDLASTAVAESSEIMWHY